MAFTDWVADEEEIDVTVEETVEEDVVEEEVTEQIEEQETPTEEVTETAPQTFNINGQDLTIEEIQTGYMRQQDYIAQREELDRMRNENKQALELVEYLRKNPELANKLMQEENVEPNVANVVNPAMERIEALERQLFKSTLDNQITALKSKYSDFNEVEVLNRATQLRTDDLEFVYNGMRGAQMETIIAQKVKEQLAQATANMQKNTQATRTVVGNAKHTEVSKTSNLTQQQMRVADMMGIDYEEYEKYL